MEGNMSVRKRAWFSRNQLKEIEPQAKALAEADGRPKKWRHKEYLDPAAKALGIEPQEAWVVSYTDAGGVRRIETFERKKEADAWADQTGVAVREGVHVADTKTVTVAEAGKLWLGSAKSHHLERTTIDQYKQHLELHIVGDGKNVSEKDRRVFIGHLKLSQLNAPTVRAFEDRLRSAGRSSAMVSYVVRSLGALLADAQERGLIVRNPVRELKRRRKRGKQDRRNGKPKVGIDIPSPEEITRIIHAAKGRWRPLLLTAIFTGLRASELRGLRWEDVDLKKGELHVRQRADRLNQIGPPKTAAGDRTVPLTPQVVNTLREWKLKCPRKDGSLWLVFPTAEGNIEWLPNILKRGLGPTLIAAGVTKPVLDAKGKPIRDEEGKPMVEAKYSGMHALRHFYASWCASIGLSMKTVQTRMGHSNIAVTMDTYTHLFPVSDDSEKLAEAERALMGGH